MGGRRGGEGLLTIEQRGKRFNHCRGVNKIQAGVVQELKLLPRGSFYRNLNTPPGSAFVFTQSHLFCLNYLS